MQEPAGVLMPPSGIHSYQSPTLEPTLEWSAQTKDDTNEGIFFDGRVSTRRAKSTKTQPRESLKQRIALEPSKFGKEKERAHDSTC